MITHINPKTVIPIHTEHPEIVGKITKVKSMVVKERKKYTL
jgi:mRNA degradation ribonuclease J1/J2